jgi:hypothetical protein
MNLYGEPFWISKSDPEIFRFGYGKRTVPKPEKSGQMNPVWIFGNCVNRCSSGSDTGIYLEFDMNPANPDMEPVGFTLRKGPDAYFFEPVYEHEHDGISFQPWEDDTRLPNTAGNWFLTADVTLNSTWNVPM